MKSNKRVTLKKICPTCNLSYNTKRESQKYCSADCHYKNKDRNRRISNAQVKNSKRISAKRKETMRAVYGVEHNSQIKQVKESKIKKSLKKYGVANPLQAGEVVEGNKRAMLERYGVENPSMSSELLKKKWDKFKKKYGASHPYQVDLFYKKMRRSLGGMTKPERYLQDYFTKHNIEFIYDYPVCYLNLKKRYDFYLPKFNLLLEFDGEYWHKESLVECRYEWQTRNFENDLLKNQIAKELGFTLVRIKGSVNLFKNWEMV